MPPRSRSHTRALERVDNTGVMADVILQQPHGAEGKHNSRSNNAQSRVKGNN